MGARKIVEWPRYRKTGSPTDKKRRQMQRVIDCIFAELLPYTDSEQQKRAPATPLPVSKPKE
jgi:hypothetical protein